MTSAPKSASSMVQKGPGRSRDRSKMRTPARAVAIWFVRFINASYRESPRKGRLESRPYKSLLMFMDIEGPFVEEPLVPEERNNPPEIPDKGLSVDYSFGDVMFHMVVAQAPMTEVEVVEEDVVQHHQDAD